MLVFWEFTFQGPIQDIGGSRYSPWHYHIFHYPCQVLGLKRMETLFLILGELESGLDLTESKPRKISNQIVNLPAPPTPLPCRQARRGLHLDATVKT